MLGRAGLLGVLQLKKESGNSEGLPKSLGMVSLATRNFFTNGVLHHIAEKEYSVLWLTGVAVQTRPCHRWRSLQAAHT